MIYILLLSAFLFLGNRGTAARLNGDYMHRVTTNLATPHYSYAKPLAGGPIKALFITPRAVASREVVELAQRFSIDFEVVTTQSPSLLASSDKYNAEVLGTNPEEKEAELLRKLRTRYDVIVFANFTFDVLPINIKYLILRHVSSGTGLVFTYGSSKDKRLFENENNKSLHRLIANLPWRAMDYFMHKGSITGYTLGKGRVVHIDYDQNALDTVAPGLTPPIKGYSRSWEQIYNYYLGLVGKSLIWASNRENRFAIELARDGMVFKRKNLPANIQMNIEASQKKNCEVAIRIIDQFGRVIESYTKEVKVEKGQIRSDINIERLPAGDYFCEGILKGNSGVLDWASISFSVVDNIRIETIEFIDNKGEVKLSVPATKDLEVSISLVDYWGRMLSKKKYSLKIGKQVISFEQSLEKCLTKLAIIKAELVDDKEIIDSKEEEFYTGIRTSSQLFPTLIWGLMGEYAVLIFHNRQLKALGFDAILDYPPSQSHRNFASIKAYDLAAANLDYVPYAYRIWSQVNSQGWTIDQMLRNEKISIEDASFPNPVVKDAVIGILCRRINGAPESNPLIYSLGDENDFSYDGGYSPSEIGAFRGFLKEKYDSIESLNVTWETEFQDWDFSIPTRNEMWNRNLFSARHDQMTFLEEEYASYHRLLAEKIRLQDKNAIVGAEGSIPGDIERTMEGLDFWAPYDNMRSDALIRSLRPDILRGNWWGGYGNLRPGMGWLIQLWPQVLLGNANMSLYYISYGVHGVLGADLMPAQYFSDVKDEYDEIRQRIGPLLANLKANDDGIAIHYSIASDHLSTMLSGSGSPAVEQTALLNLLDREGYGYRFLSSNQIENGELLSGSFKVIFLLLSQALSDKEKVELKEFVKQGGTVIADLNPGVADGNCKLHVICENLLFGVTIGDVKYQPVSNIEIKGDDNFSKSINIKNSIINSSVKITDAKAMAYINETPLIVHNNIDIGSAYLLNLTLSSINEEPVAAEIVRYLLERAGVNRRFECETNDRTIAKSYKNGEQDIITVCFPQILSGGWCLRISEPKHVWDSRKGEYLGYGTQFDIPAYADRQPAYIFALQKDNQYKISFNLPARCSLGDNIKCSLKIFDDNVDCRIVRLEVFTPDGKLFEPFTRTIRVDANGVDFMLDFALNDQTGTWKLKASDVATGIEMEKLVEVN